MAAGATYDKLRRDLHQFDAGAVGRHFSMPLLFLQGEHDLFTITSEVQHFMEGVDAPRAELVTIQGGGHNCIFLRDRVLDALRARFGRADASMGNKETP